MNHELSFDDFSSGFRPQSTILEKKAMACLLCSFGRGFGPQILPKGAAKGAPKPEGGGSFGVCQENWSSCFAYNKFIEARMRLAKRVDTRWIWPIRRRGVGSQQAELQRHGAYWGSGVLTLIQAFSWCRNGMQRHATTRSDFSPCLISRSPWAARRASYSTSMASPGICRRLGVRSVACPPPSCFEDLLVF